MRSKIIQSLRVPSLLLAGALQVLPMARAVLPTSGTAANVLAIVFRWAVGATATAGAFNAVSGASTVITSPLTAAPVQGTAFTLRLTTAPNQAHYWTAVGLPSGLTLTGTSGSVNWSVAGTPTVSGTFRVALTAKSSSSAPAKETVTSTLVLNIAAGGTRPAITGPPTSLTVTQGQSATFSVTATGTAPLTYQWRFGSANLSGKTTASLVLNSTTTANAGNYAVVVSNGSGSVTSAVATLTVVVPTVAPSISSQPSSLTVTQGQSAAFSVTATGTAPLSYQWRFGGANLSGQTAASLVINPSTTGNTGNYTVVIANSAGSVTSAVATLTVIVPAVAPSISSQPSSLTVTQGQSASFSVTAGGTAPLSYQWRFGGANLSGQTGTSLVINPATTNNAGNYTVVVANSAGSVTSSVAALTVIVPAVAPSISSQPSSLTVTQGQSAAFSVTAGGTAPLSYQWRFGGANLSGQTGTSLVINPATTNNAGNYTVVVANSAGSVTSVVATLTVVVPGNALQIVSQPSSLTITQNQSASFTVAATGTAPLSYQWRFNGANLSGKTATSLVINPATTNNAGNYDAIVSNGSGSVTSAVATLTVIVPAIAPGITSQPSSLTVTQNQSASFSVTATGTAPLSYQWRFNGANLSGKTATSLVINPATTNNAGNYDAIVSNGSGSVTSAVATLTVIVPTIAPGITSQPSSLTVTQNQSASFSVAATGTAPLSYQWRFNGASLSGQTGTGLVINPATTNNAGNYTVVVANSAGSVTSSVATLTVVVPSAAPAITTQPASLSVTSGQSASFTVTASGSAPLNYQWRFGGANLSGQTGTSLVINPATTNRAGNYDVVVANSVGSVTSLVATLTVVQPAQAQARLVVQVNGPGTVTPNYNGQLLLVGATYTMTATPSNGCTFQNWTGSLTADTSALTFVMQSNLVLQANFASDQVKFVKGSYNGLYSDDSGVSLFSSGSFTIATTTKGKYSGALVLVGKKYTFSGQFNPQGFATNSIGRGRLSRLTVELALNPADTDQVTGRVTDGVWSAAIQADRVTFDAKTNRAPQAGTYTLVIPGAADKSDSPAGYGSGAVKVDALGKVTFTGKLADGTKVTRSTTLSKNADWPFFAPLYSGVGSIIGWLQFTNSPDGDISGLANWIKLQQPSAKFYPAGFAIGSDVLGSKYVPPTAGSPVLDYIVDHIHLTGGNLTQDATSQIGIQSNTRLGSQNGIKFSLVLNPAKGLFTGSFVSPVTGKSVAMTGAVLQKQSMGCGFFLGTNQSGTVYFAP